MRVPGMREGFRRWRIAGVLSLAVLTLGFTVIVMNEVQSFSPEDPLQPFLYDRYPASPADCGILLAGEPITSKAGASHEVRVAVAVDEAWQAKFGDDAERQARSVIEDIAPLFRPFQIQLTPVKFVYWRSDQVPASIDPLLAEVKRSVALEGVDVVLAITGLHLHGADGKAGIGGRYALIEHHPGYPERDRFVAAHELAHLFGALHTVEESEGSDLMAGEGFNHDLEWSGCHERLLRLNASRFEEGVDPVTPDVGS